MISKQQVTRIKAAAFDLSDSSSSSSCDEGAGYNSSDVMIPERLDGPEVKH